VGGGGGEENAGGRGGGGRRVETRGGKREGEKGGGRLGLSGASARQPEWVTSLKNRRHGVTPHKRPNTGRAGKKG